MKFATLIAASLLALSLGPATVAPGAALVAGCGGCYDSSDLAVSIAPVSDCLQLEGADNSCGGSRLHGTNACTVPLVISGSITDSRTDYTAAPGAAVDVRLADSIKHDSATGTSYVVPMTLGTTSVVATFGY